MQERFRLRQIVAVALDNMMNVLSIMVDLTFDMAQHESRVIL